MYNLYLFTGNEFRCSPALPCQLLEEVGLVTQVRLCCELDSFPSNVEFRKVICGDGVYVPITSEAVSVWSTSNHDLDLLTNI